MSATTNRFLRQLQTSAPEAEDEDELVYENNRFLRQIPKKEPQLPSPAREIESGRRKVGDLLKAAPRGVMQGALGAAKGALYTSPAGVPAILGEIALPGAIEQNIRDEEEFERDLPPKLREALDLPEFKPEVAREASRKLVKKITGGKGVIDAAIAAPFTAAGIETEPQSGTEAAIRNTSELITALGGPRGFTNLVFEHLPNSIKGFFRDKLGALEKLLVGDEPLPKSVYESAQKALEELQTQEAAILETKALAERPSFLPKEMPKVPQPGTQQAPSLRGRVTEGGEDIGMRPAPARPPQNLQQDIGEVFSPTEFRNTTQGGEAIKNKVIELDEAAYRDVNRLYQRSRELNEAVEEIHPQLVNSLMERLQGLNAIPSPSGPQTQLITSLENIIGALAETEGNAIVGYKPISNQTLIDQVQSLRQKVDYDFAHGNAKNIFRPTINDIQNSVRSAAQQAGNEEALQSFDEARNAYREWVTRFDNDYIRPIRNIQNRDYSKIFKGSLDVDEFNELRSILDADPQGNLISNGIQREIANKYLSKYYEKPVQHTLKEFNKDLRELEAIITPEQATEVRNRFLRAKESRTPGFKAEKIKITEPDRKAAKYLDMKPEQVHKMFDTRSGIKEAKKDLSKTEEGKKVFETLRRQKVRDILRENQIEKEFTGNDLYKTLNKRENFELLSELIGEGETEAARLSAKELGKKKMTAEALKKVGEHALSLKFIKFIFPLL